MEKKMKKTKKLVAIFCTLALLSTVFVGCKSSSSTSSETSTGSQCNTSHDVVGFSNKA